MDAYDYRNCQSLFGGAARVHEQSGGICQLCDAGMDGLDFDLWRQLTVEHLIGESQGGYLRQILASLARRFPDLAPAERTAIARTIDRANTVTACAFCKSTTSRWQAGKRMDDLIKESPGSGQVLGEVTAVLDDVLNEKRHDVQWKLQAVRGEYESRVRPRLEDARAHQAFRVRPSALFSSKVELIVARIRSDVAALPADFTKPPGYGHLPLALIDAVYSIRTRYPVVERVVAAYAEVADAAVAPLSARNDPAFTEHGLDQFLARAGGLRGERLADALFAGSRSRTAGRLKADVCVEVARRLRDTGVTDVDSLRRRADDSDVRQAWTGVHGLGWATWQYFCALAGIDNFKPDIMLTRFVAQTLRLSVTPAEAEMLLAGALQELQEKLPGLDKRTLDHTVWRFQRTLP